MPSTIKNVRDLLDTIRSGRIVELAPSEMDQWLPRIAATTPWSIFLSQHFLLLYHADPDIVGLDQTVFLADRETIRADVMAFFQMKGCLVRPTVLSRHLTMLIAHTESPVMFGTVISTDLLFYLLDTRQDPSYMGKLRHEIIHAAWGALFGEAPALFNEGVAVAVETLSQTGMCERDLFAGIPSLDSLPPLNSLCQNERFFQGGTNLYRASGTLVHYLGERWSWERLGCLFQASHFEDPAIQDKFVEIYGVSLDDVDREWRIFCQQKIAQRPSMP